jgi:hypothetical protein
MSLESDRAEIEHQWILYPHTIPYYHRRYLGVVDAAPEGLLRGMLELQATQVVLENLSEAENESEITNADRSKEIILDTSTGKASSS